MRVVCGRVVTAGWRVAFLVTVTAHCTPQLAAVAVSASAAVIVGVLVEWASYVQFVSLEVGLLPQLSLSLDLLLLARS